METSIPCKVYIKSHSLEKQFPSLYPGPTQSGPPLFGFSIRQVEAKGWGLFPAFAETREWWGWGTQGSNPHPANDWVFMCAKRRAPVLTFRHCHEDEKRQPMKKTGALAHTPPGSEYTPAMRCLRSRARWRGSFSFPSAPEPMRLYRFLPVDSLSTPAPSPYSNP